MSLLMLNLDCFKTVNDTWGHPTGDRVLQALAEIMRSLVRDHDCAGRLGGEEFAVILPETELSGALINAERFRAAVEQAKIACATDGNNVVRVTVSIGVAELQGRETLDLWFGRADKTLCRAKNAGRNQVCPAEALPIADR